MISATAMPAVWTNWRSSAENTDATVGVATTNCEHSYEGGET